VFILEVRLRPSKDARLEGESMGIGGNGRIGFPKRDRVDGPEAGLFR
jgi:hypothetical protein